MMRIMIACEIANKSENMENQKHRVFWENIVFFQVPAISWVLGSSGTYKKKNKHFTSHRDRFISSSLS